jgi:hypothetical protein
MQPVCGQEASYREVIERVEQFPGVRALEVITATGTCAVKIEILDSWLDDSLVHYLRTLLDTKDPPHDVAQRTLGLQLVR